MVWPRSSEGTAARESPDLASTVAPLMTTRPALLTSDRVSTAAVGDGASPPTDIIARRASRTAAASNRSVLSARMKRKAPMPNNAAARAVVTVQMRASRRRNRCGNGRCAAVTVQPVAEATDRLDQRSLRRSSSVESALGDGWKGAFRRLVPAHREILELVAVHRLSYQEAADALGLPLGTVMSRLHRARAQVRSHLASPPRSTP